MSRVDGDFILYVNRPDLAVMGFIRYPHMAFKAIAGLSCQMRLECDSRGESETMTADFFWIVENTSFDAVLSCVARTQTR